MNYNPRWHNALGDNPLGMIQTVEMVEQWAKDKRKTIEDDIEKKNAKKVDGWINTLTFPQIVIFCFTFGPWIGTAQYLMIKAVLKNLTGN